MFIVLLLCAYIRKVCKVDGAARNAMKEGS